MFKVGETWLTRDNQKVKILYISEESNKWYPVTVKNIDTGRKYTVDRQGCWESYYDKDPNPEDLIKRINNE